uniref:Uncharacterized protein n=1 Tax=Pseudomonas fluorescens TaxID=294 RepID=A0A5E6QPL7_PSEFL|nr:hypothetical protein PS652_01150 [Pseudomonas fluorescens]
MPRFWFRCLIIARSSLALDQRSGVGCCKQRTNGVLHAQPVFFAPAPGHAPGLAFHPSLPQAGVVGLAGSDNHRSDHPVHGPGHSPAGRPGFHDPVAAPAQPVHRLVPAFGFGPGDRHLQSLLPGVMDWRALCGRYPPAGVRSPDLPAPGLFREQPQLGDPVAADRRHHLAAIGDRFVVVAVPAQRPDGAGRHRPAVCHQPQAHQHRGAGLAAGAGADPDLRPARAQPVAAKPGPGRRCRQLCGRNPRPDQDRAGL